MAPEKPKHLPDNFAGWKTLVEEVWGTRTPQHIYITGLAAIRGQSGKPADKDRLWDYLQTLRER